jgi:hypothetical protein
MGPIEGVVIVLPINDITYQAAPKGERTAPEQAQLCSTQTVKLPDVSAIPAELKARKQWVVWKYEQRDGKETKVPYVPSSPVNRRASPTDPSTWSSFSDAISRLRADPSLHGVGFVFSSEDPFAGIDLDKCRDPESGEIEPWALKIISSLHSYTETSPSGTGVKIWVMGKVPLGGNRRGNIEMYDQARYFTVTGSHLQMTPRRIEERWQALSEIHANLFPTPPQQGRADARCVVTNLDDDDVIEKASGAKNGDEFQRLWSGNWEGLAPSQSEADLQLCSTLAFYAGTDPARIDALFRRSGLMRPKWDERHGADGRTYGEMTIQRAIDGKTAFFGRVATDDADGSDGHDPDGRVAHRSQTDVLLEIGGAAQVLQDETGDAYGRIVVNSHLETWPVTSTQFRRWLTYQYYCKYRKAPSEQSLKDTIGVLASNAQWNGSKHAVHLRVAPDGFGGVYIDLCDDTWRAVHATADGWRIVENPPVIFRRSRGMKPLPEPQRGGSLEDLRRFINIPDDDAWTLLKAWMVGALLARGPYPVLVFYGEQGSAKTTSAKIVRRLVDPYKPELRSSPKDQRDFAIAAKSNWVIALDNVSSVPQWLSDALCRLVTGDGFATRQLHTDTEEVLIEAQRPIVMTGITEFVVRPDLLDRTVQVTLSPIPDDQRRSEEDLWDQFEAACPRLFGALLDRLSGALRERPHVHLKRLPRMADFARLAVAAERGAGEDERFLSAYEGVRSVAHWQAIESSSIGGPIMRLLGREDFKGQWGGTAQQLLHDLSDLAGDGVSRDHLWPRSARQLSGELRRLRPALTGVGIVVDLNRRRGSNGERYIHLADPQRITRAKGRERPSGSSGLSATTKENGLPMPDEACLSGDVPAGPGHRQPERIDDDDPGDTF